VPPISDDETGILSGIKLKKIFVCFCLRICFGNGSCVQVRREVKEITYYVSDCERDTRSK
jgi:hypothetical protein